MSSFLIRPPGPYNLPLSLRAGRSFVETSEALSSAATSPAVLRTPALVDDQVGVLEIEQLEVDPPVLRASWSGSEQLSWPALAARVVRAELDLRGFYESVRGHQLMANLVGHLHGLKPFRPASLFEMAVIAIMEQQISLLAAYRIRERLVRRFGTPVEELITFPAPRVLAEASYDELRACGLSGRKVEYVQEFSRDVADGRVDLDALEELPDQLVIERLLSLRGFGRWSAEYILVRGLGRVDVVPADDLGVRTVMGRLLGEGQRVAAGEARELLAPLAPYRGLAVFYLLAADRLGVPYRPAS